MLKIRALMERAGEITVLQSIRNHPSIRVATISLALIGAIALGQYLWGDPFLSPWASSRVRVIANEVPMPEEDPPQLLREPDVIPQGSPSAPAEMSGVTYAPPEQPREIETSTMNEINWAHSHQPIQGQVVTAFGFGYAEFFDDYRLHEGIAYTAPQGAPVIAALGGTVETIYEDQLHGPTIILDHGHGWQSIYAPVEDITPLPGQWVPGGDQLGRLASPPPIGANNGSRFHFALHHHGEPVDPALYLK